MHELAHQWFGDAVSVEKWRDTWLNEGFATYVEWLWQETHGGRTVHGNLVDNYDRYAADSPFWKLKVSDPGPDEIFSAPIYERGGMMLSALRCRLGATQMRDLVRDWVDQHRGGTGSGEQFRELAASRGGPGMEQFFSTWLDDPRRPARNQPNGLTGCS